MWFNPIPFVLDTDQKWMCEAISLARRAETQGEVPVGAVLVKGDTCVARAWNRPIGACDPTAHAEIVALRTAGEVLHNYRLIDTSLYVTLEPCIMCVGAIAHARVKRLVFGAPDPKRGAVCSALELCNAEFLNHQIEWQGGIMSEDCSKLLIEFFDKKRA